MGRRPIFLPTGGSSQNLVTQSNEYPAKSGDREAAGKWPSGSQKRPDVLRQFLRHLFWQEVAGRHHAALRLDGGAILPRLQNVVHAMERPFLRPQHEQRTLNFFVEVHLIVLKVNRGSRAIVLANGMDRSRLPERPQVFSKNGWTDPVR